MKSKKRRDMAAFLISLASVLFMLVALANLNRIFPPPELEVYADLEAAEGLVISNSREGTNPGAPIEMEVFGDFGCGNYADSADTLKRLMLVYGKNLNVRYRHYPQFENSDIAAAASECARDQNSFWPYHDLLTAGGPQELNRQVILLHASRLSIDMDYFNSCLDSEAKMELVASDKRHGEEMLVTGTPTFFINGRMFRGTQPYSRFKDVIDSELEISETG